MKICHCKNAQLLCPVSTAWVLPTWSASYRNVSIDFEYVGKGARSTSMAVISVNFAEVRKLKGLSAPGAIESFNPSYIPGLDGLCGVAIIGVMLYHYGRTAGGHLGVDIFFTISGFLQVFCFGNGRLNKK